ncbi:MAG: hypothetical protein HOV80_22105 [Polyangiaceae bacterium]|nr:hypothetical protein [Polyangiaceae bacterium]
MRRYINPDTEDEKEDAQHAKLWSMARGVFPEAGSRLWVLRVCIYLRANDTDGESTGISPEAESVADKLLQVVHRLHVYDDGGASIEGWRFHVTDDDMESGVLGATRKIRETLPEASSIRVVDIPELIERDIVAEIAEVAAPLFAELLTRKAKAKRFTVDEEPKPAAAQ